MDGLVSINYAQLDRALSVVGGNILPQTLEITRDERKRQLPEVRVIDGERVTIRNKDEATVIRNHGQGLPWLLAFLLLLLSVVVVYSTIYLNDWLYRLSVVRHGKPGGGAARKLSGMSDWLCSRLRTRGALNVSRMRKKQACDPSPTGLRKFLTCYNFSYELWDPTGSYDDAQRRIIAEQNSFVEAVRAIDEGDRELAEACLTNVRRILRRHLNYRPDYFDIIEAKAVYLVTVLTNAMSGPVVGVDDDERRAVVAAFNPSDCGLPNLDSCSLDEIKNFDLSEVAIGEGTNVEQARGYLNLCRNIQCMIETIGTVQFLGVLSSYTGPQYPCISQAFAEDKRIRKERLKDKDNITTADIIAYLVSGVMAAYALVAVSKGGITLFKFMKNYAGGGGDGPGSSRRIRQLEAALPSVPQPEELTMMERLRRLQSSDNDLVLRRNPSDMLSQVVRDVVADVDSSDIAEFLNDPARMTEAALELRLTRIMSAEGSPVDVIEPGGQELISMQVHGESLTVINAGTDSPTVIRSASLSTRHRSSGIEIGSFAVDKVLPYEVEGENDDHGDAGKKPTVAQALMIGGGAVKGQGNLGVTNGKELLKVLGSSRSIGKMSGKMAV